MNLQTCGANEHLVEALVNRDVRFVVVGGVATTFHVPERQTADPGELDLLIDPSPANATKVIAALEPLGVLGLTVEGLTRPNTQLRLKRVFVGGAFYADILTPRADEDFAIYWEQASENRIGWASVKVISLPDQIARLKHSDQEKHVRDVEVLARALRQRG
jgi:hypothetical protein